LEIEEEKCRKELQSSLNSYRCHIIDEEIKERDREKQKKYDEEHKEEKAEKAKTHYKANREVLLEKSKNNYEANKESILEKKKEKFNCDCGGKFTISNKSLHEKSKKHQQFLQQ